MSDICAIYRKTIEPTPIIMPWGDNGENILLPFPPATIAGGDFVCTRHLLSDWAGVHPEAIRRGFIPWKTIKDGGYKVTAIPDENGEYCKAPWSDGVYEIGSLVTYDPECECCNGS